MGPGFSLSGDGEAIKDLLNADESIDLILQDMTAGNSGSGSFLYGQEHVYITYAPVSVKNVFPVNSSDITRGVKNQTTLIYSLALVELESTIMQSSQSIDASISRVVGVCIGVLSALIILSAVLMLRIAFRVATYMTEPILELLEVLKEINQLSIYA
jgi:predicted NACHT family NTPase